MTIQFSTKIFPQADLQSAKALNSSLKSLLAHNADCLVLGYSKADLGSFSGAKAAKSKAGFLAELDRLLDGSLSHAHLLGDLDEKQSSVCILRAEKSWATNGIKAKRILLLGLGDLDLVSERSLTSFSKVVRAGLKALSGGSIENALWFVPSFAQKSELIAQEIRLTIQYAGDQAYRFGVRQPAVIVFTDDARRDLARLDGDRLVNDAFLLSVVTHFHVPRCGEIFAERVTDEAVISEYAPQVLVVSEKYAEQIESFALKPVGSTPNAVDRIDLRHVFVSSVHTQTQTPVVRQRQQMADHGITRDVGIG